MGSLHCSSKGASSVSTLLLGLLAGCALGTPGPEDGGRRFLPPRDATSEDAPQDASDARPPPDDASPRPDAAGCPGGCDDGIACTADSCEGGVCVHRRDDTLCGPSELCDPTEGCVPAPDCRSDTECANGAFCDGTERCIEERCVSGTPPCSGSTPRCDESLDRCVACLEAAHCDDGLACNGTERCVEGACVSGEPVRCDDGIACTMDRCVEPSGSCRNEGPDEDGDGVVAASCADGADCDDTDPDVRPGATERCNQRDDDCDGACDENVPGCRIGVHRAYSASLQDHFYTTDRAEASCCGYALQAENYFYLYRSSGSSLVRLYRCYSARNEDHFYTTSSTCEGSSAYVQEGWLGYLRRRAAGPGCGGTELFRLWHPGSRDHAYTISPTERDRLLGQGYRLENSPGYVWTSP